MSRKIDPNDPNFQGKEGQPKCRGGRKLLAGAGFERYTAKTGSRMLTVRFVCLRDFAGVADEQHEVFENFTLEDSSMWRFVKYVQAVGYSEAFDVDDDADIEKIITYNDGYVVGDIEVETYDGKDQPKVRRWSAAPPTDQDPDWPAWIEAAETRHAEYLEWRAQNPRGSRSGGVGGGGGGGRGSGGSGSRAGGGYDGGDFPF